MLYSSCRMNIANCKGTNICRWFFMFTFSVRYLGRISPVNFVGILNCYFNWNMYKAVHSSNTQWNNCRKIEHQIYARIIQWLIEPFFFYRRKEVKINLHIRSMLSTFTHKQYTVGFNSIFFLNINHKIIVDLRSVQLHF